MNGPRIVWLAAADARGHLVRAHLARGLFARRGIAADIVTTSEQGRQFLAALGTPSEVLSPHYGVAFDAWQNMDRRRTEAVILRYFLTPGRGLSDLSRLREISASATYIVNDFHPLPLLAGERLGRVVHVYGDSLYRAIARHFEGRGTGRLDRRFAEVIAKLAARAHARVEHGLSAPISGGVRPSDRTLLLPPLFSLPKRSRPLVRASLGLRPGQKLAAVYLNPHFRDERLIVALKGSLEPRGYVLCGIAEGLAGKSGFAASDGLFADVIAASDVLVSAPGMASCAQARAFGVPFVALATHQPEQRANLKALSSYPNVVPLDLCSPAVRDDLGCALGAAVDRATSAASMAEDDGGERLVQARSVHDLWARTLTALLPEQSSVSAGSAQRLDVFSTEVQP